MFRPKSTIKPEAVPAGHKLEEHEIKAILESLIKLEDFKASDLAPLLRLEPKETNQVILAIDGLKESERQLLLDLAKKHDATCIQLLDRAVDYVKEHTRLTSKELRNHIQDSIYSYVYNKYCALYEKKHGADDIINSEEIVINKKLKNPKADKIRNSLFSTITSNESDEKKLALFEKSYQKLQQEGGFLDIFKREK